MDAEEKYYNLPSKPLSKDVKKEGKGLKMSSPKKLVITRTL